MTSFGLGEIGLIVLLALLVFDAKQVAGAARWMRNMRMKIFQIQRDWREQIDKLVEEEENQIAPGPQADTPESLRAWSKSRVLALPAEERETANEAVCQRVLDLSVFQEASSIGAYCALPDELQTAKILAAILESGKKLYLPYIESGTLAFSQITDLEADLELGNFGILEPVAAKRAPASQTPDLLLVPGRCFDEDCNRIGRGKGFYDRYLAISRPGKVGLCFDVQIATKKLNMQKHDVPMDFVVTEKRILQKKK